MKCISNALWWTGAFALSLTGAALLLGFVGFLLESASYNDALREACLKRAKGWEDVQRCP